MNAAGTRPERSHDLAGAIQPQDGFIPVRPGLRDLHQAGNQHDHITNRIPFRKDGVSAGVLLISPRCQDEIAICRIHVGE